MSDDSGAYNALQGSISSMTIPPAKRFLEQESHPFFRTLQPITSPSRDLILRSI